MGDIFLGWLLHMCQGGYEGAKWIIRGSDKKNMFWVCVDDIFADKS